MSHLRSLCTRLNNIFLPYYGFYEILQSNIYTKECLALFLRHMGRSSRSILNKIMTHFPVFTMYASHIESLYLLLYGWNMKSRKIKNIKLLPHFQQYMITSEYQEIVDQIFAFRYMIEKISIISNLLQTLEGEELRSFAKYDQFNELETLCKYLIQILPTIDKNQLDFYNVQAH